MSNFASREHRLLGAAGALAFLLYAMNFLCFFVDDEAITFVYSQNLLRGRGLSYSAFEGHVEGYSNLLQVWTGAGLLAAINVVGLPKIAVFPAAKALSLASGAALAVLVAAALHVVPSANPPSRLAGLAVLVFSGPVAVWSCSSLETVPFVLLFTGFTTALLVASPRAAVVAAVLGSATLLARIDGFVYVGAVWAAAFLVATAAERHRLLWRVAAPIALLFGIYQAWRFLYFGSLLSLPLQTKVAYKLFPSDAVVSYMPETSYLARFLEHYHPAVLLALALGWLPFWRRGDDRRPFALLATAAAVAAYAAVVGDWMFGFRFFAALFPLLALLAACTVAQLARRSRVLGVVCAAAVIVWSGITARSFVHAFERADRLANWKSWWSDPTLETARFFAPYYPLYEDARGVITPGSVTVNNQAGFLPFLLDLENIDDLGITSRFFATLPTADIIFTEVGRYHPLTDRPPLRAGELYLVHREPRHLIVWRHLLRSANNGHVPQQLLGDHFRLVLESDFQAIYERTDLRLPRQQPSDFRENLAHPAHVDMAAIQGAPIERAMIRDELPFLRGEVGRYSVGGSLSFEFHLAEDDPLFEVWIDSIVSTADAQAELVMRGPGGPAFREQLNLKRGQPLQYRRQLDRPMHGATLVLRVTPVAAGEAALELTDLRVLGQSDALREYIARELFK